MSEEGGNQLTFIVVGDGGVGKSALTIQFVESRFVSDYNPTIEDSFSKKTKIDGVVSTLRILDTAGQEEYSALREAHFSRANGFMLVYAVTDRVGFDSIPNTRSHILTFLDATEFPMILVGNKSDAALERKVGSREGQELAKSFGIPFRETSAKTGANVEESFFDLARLVRKMHNPRAPGQRAAIDSPDYFSRSGRGAGGRSPRGKCSIC